MDSRSCLGGCAVAAYVILSTAISEWFARSISLIYHQGLSAISIWNFVASILTVSVWLMIPLLWLGYTSHWRSLFKTLSLAALIAMGPTLFGLNLLGSYLEAIDYRDMCSKPCVKNIQAVALMLRDVHWTILYFISIMSSTTLCLFVYFKYFASSEQMQQRRSFIPLEYINFLSNQEDPCSICLQGILAGESAAIIKRCAHAYHAECIEAWLAIKDRCPICRCVV